MLALGINFVGARRFSRLGILVLLVACVVAAVLAMDVQELEERATNAETRLAQLKKMAKRQSARQEAGQNAGRPSASADEIKLVYRIVRAVRQPWDTMLSALEQVDTGNVALLSLDADAANNTLRMSLEAKSAADAFAYIEALRKSPHFSDVQMVAHEEKQSGAVKVFSFMLALVWKATA